ncbi:N-acetylglucosamine kinase [Glaciibacter superstes]|uniref:N-acetylglucosamine kinase n=1 Tax=Glaciibacter superstes TaxID=501023 RepID=UPI0005259939|nr:BadF/BadG/BcrA/BcrD ATPase family protein [Glaciibacter superstes]
MNESPKRRGIIVAVDGGGSKTDAVALDETGAVLARARRPGTSPHMIGLAASVAVVNELVEEVTRAANDGPVLRAHLYVSGLDLPVEIADFERAIRRLPWANELWAAGGIVVDNDLFALLRAGTNEKDAVAVICGTGINCVGVGADGRTVRYASLGMISGDWGGGFALGESGLWHAARAEDGRGPETILRREIPRAYGLETVSEVTEALHFKRVTRASLADLSPVVFGASAGGDLVAGSIVDHQAEEIVTLAATTLRRLDLLERAVPVVLGGGVIAARDARLTEEMRRGLDAQAPHAHLELVSSPPILGAALLALEAQGASSGALAAAQIELSVEPALAG